MADETVLTCCVAVVNTVGVSIRDFCASNVAKLQKTENHYKEGELITGEAPVWTCSSESPVYSMCIHLWGLEASVMCKSS